MKAFRNATTATQMIANGLADLLHFYPLRTRTFLASSKLSEQVFPRCRFCFAVGEAVPFKDGTFDAVISRVALPYMNIQRHY